MATVTVSTTAALLSALSNAKDGDTILLSPGTYSGVVLYGLNFPNGVNIASADPNDPAKLLDLTVRSSSGLNFSNLEMDASGSSSYYPFQVLSSSDVHFSNVHVHGSLNGSPADDISSFMIRDSSNVSVVDSEFEELSHGINFLNSSHLLFHGNEFHDLRIDGIRGGGSSYVTITDNSFTNFRPQEGDHPDAIQFWTTNTTSIAHDIVITGNVITRGDGGIMQGIFLTDQVGTLPYTNVIISDNILVGTMWNGIMIGNGASVQITDNIVASLPDQLTWIRLEGLVDSVVTGNYAGDYIEKLFTNVTSGNNVEARPTYEQAMQMLNDWLAAHSDSSTDGGTTDGGTDGGTTDGGTTDGGGTDGGTTDGGTSDGGTTDGGTVEPAPAPAPAPEPEPEPVPTTDSGGGSGKGFGRGDGGLAKGKIKVKGETVTLEASSDATLSTSDSTSGGPRKSMSLSSESTSTASTTSSTDSADSHDLLSNTTAVETYDADQTITQDQTIVLLGTYEGGTNFNMPDLW